MRTKKSLLFLLFLYLFSSCSGKKAVEEEIFFTLKLRVLFKLPSFEDVKAKFEVHDIFSGKKFEGESQIYQSQGITYVSFLLPFSNSQYRAYINLIYKGIALVEYTATFSPRIPEYDITDISKANLPDSDNDGSSNLDEILSGTDPLDPESCPAKKFYIDQDQDGFGDSNLYVLSCKKPDGLSDVGGDCDDSSPEINPSKQEICGDGKDNNCDGKVDENCPSSCVFFPDVDGDGFGEADPIEKPDCTMPQGYTTQAGDCDVNNPAVNPSASEVCNLIDDNCDGFVDEGFPACLTPSAPQINFISWYILGISWKDNSKNESKFIVEVSESEDFSYVVTKQEFGKDITYGYIFGLEPGKRYFIRVYAENLFGRSGYSDVISALTKNLNFLDSVSSVGLGLYHSCAVLSDGKLYCWGDNSFGQIIATSDFDCDGDGKLECVLNPSYSDSVSALDVSAGAYHTCYLDYMKNLNCLGRGDYGQIDGSSISIQNSITKVLENVRAFSLGYAHSCAIKNDGSLYCWGWNYYGQVGTSYQYGDIATSPYKIFSFGVSHVSLGYAHTCAVKQDGSLWCWGWNGYGQLGVSSPNSSTHQAQLVFSSGISKVCAGYYHSCALSFDGKLYCWGGNDKGQVGDGSFDIQRNPKQVMENISDVVCGWYHTCALKSSGELICWGDGTYGQTGGNSLFNYVGNGVQRVFAGAFHTCFIKDNYLWCFGLNSSAQLGNGKKQLVSSSPSKVLKDK